MYLLGVGTEVKERERALPELFGVAGSLFIGVAKMSLASSEAGFKSKRNLAFDY